MCLGTTLMLMQLHDGFWTLSICLSKYVQNVGRICFDHVTKHIGKGYKLAKREENPYSMGYLPRVGCATSIGTRWGILLPVLDRSNKVDG